MTDLMLEALVYADSAHVAHLVLEGRSADADEYATRDDVAARIAAWKAGRK